MILKFEKKAFEKDKNWKKICKGIFSFNNCQKLKNQYLISKLKKMKEKRAYRKT